MAELITGHRQDHEPRVGVAHVQLLHLRVVPDRCASERGDVLDQNHFALQLWEAERLPRQQFSC